MKSGKVLQFYSVKKLEALSVMLMLMVMVAFGSFCNNDRNSCHAVIALTLRMNLGSLPCRTNFERFGRPCIFGTCAHGELGLARDRYDPRLGAGSPGSK